MKKSIFLFLTIVLFASKNEAKAQAANGNYPGSAVITWNASHTAGTINCLFSSMICYNISFNHYITVYTSSGEVNGWVPMAFGDPNWKPMEFEPVQFDTENYPEQ